MSMSVFDRIRQALRPAPVDVVIVDDAQPPDDPNALGSGEPQRGPGVYFNPITNVGTRRDAAWWDQWRKPKSLNKEQREAMSRDALIRRALSIKADDATREGWRVDIDTKSLEALGETRDAAELADAVQDYEDREQIALPAKIADAILRADLHKYAIVWLGVQDGPGPEGQGTDWTLPVDTAAIKRIAWARVYDARDVDIVRLYGPEDDEFSTPEAYAITRIDGVLPDGWRNDRGEGIRSGDSGGIRHTLTMPEGPDGAQLSEIIVHASRCLLFVADDAIPVPDRIQWHLANYFKALSAISRGAGEFAQTVYRIKDWVWKTRNRDSGASLERVSALERMRGLYNAVILDSETEDFERSSGAVSGLEKMSNPSMVDICAAIGVPVTYFWGVSPGGFGAGTSEIQIYNGAVKVWQGRRITSQLRKAHGYILIAEDGPQISIRPESREIVYADLTPTDDTETQTILTARAGLVLAVYAATLSSVDEARKALTALDAPGFSFKLEGPLLLPGGAPGAPAPALGVVPEVPAPEPDEDIEDIPEPEPDPLEIAFSNDPLPTDTGTAPVIAAALSAELGSKVPTVRITRLAREGKIRSWDLLGGKPVHSKREIKMVLAQLNGMMPDDDPDIDESTE